MTITANQLVAANLRRARELRGLTQEQAAEQLEPYLGTRWSPAVFSAAETSVRTKRVREFSANEILAFACAFELPVTWFFLPLEPEGDALAGTDDFPSVRTNGSELAAGELLDAVFPYGGSTELSLRLVKIVARLPKRLRTKADDAVLRWTREKMRAAVWSVVGEWGALAARMREHANALDRIQTIALEGVGQQLEDAERKETSVG
jgi:transcriptional regulator with XRE-family HTH domain